jgi:fibronectin type 3 domain-containing protein
VGRALAVAGACWALAASLHAAEVKLAWDPSPDADVTNYRVYWGYQSRTYTTWFDVGNVTNATVGALADGTRYFFAVTATTDDGRESDYSNEAEYTTPLPPPAAPVVELRPGANPWEVQLAWSASADSRVTNYRICWGTQSGTYTSSRDVGNVTTATIGSLAAGTTYYFAVLAVTSDGLQSAYSNEVSYTTPWPPPAAPVVELQPGANPWEVQLAWSASADSRVTNYRVYWGTRSRTYSAAFDVGNVTRATVSGLAAGTTYYFAVQAMTSDGQQSPLSNEVSYTTPLPPLAVPVLELRPGTETTEVVLAWTPIPDPAVNNYRVYWGTQSRTYSASLNVGNVATATVRSLVAGTTYFFAVTATASDGRESAFSNEASYTVPLPPPEPPVLEVKAGSSATEVNLTWTPSPGADVVQYRVYWGEQSGAYTESVDAGNVTTLTLDSLVPGTTYFFAVTALTADGRESDYSNEVEYTAPAPPPPSLVAKTPPVLVGVVSRLSHRAAGTFDLPLNLSSPFSVEGRITSALELVFRFDKPVTAAAASVVRGVGTISAPPVVNGTEVTVGLSSVASRQWLVVRLTDVRGQDGAVLSEAGVALGVLGGDVNGDGVISSSDVELVRAVSGQLVNANNYRADVNLSGTLSSADVQTVRMRVGHRVPAY